MTLNHIIIAGNLCTDIELKQTGTGISVARFNVAVDRRYEPKDGEKRTDFFNCVAWRHNAEFVARYGKKGDTVVIEGRVETEKWQDKQGVSRERQTVVVEALQLASHRRTEGAQEAKTDKAEYVPTHYAQNAESGFVEVDTDLGLPF
jgi:single-strand DNA-binding protein